MSADWLEIADADTYMATRHGASTYWTSGADKAGALRTAQDDLETSGLFSFKDSDGVDLGTTPTDAMKYAVCEQALFLLRDPDMETRLHLQSQGVRSASVVSEAYAGTQQIPIAPRAVRWARTYWVGNSFEVSR